MEITKIILPKTDPDKVFEYTNNYIEELSQTKEYKIAQKYLKRKCEVEKILSKTEIIAGILAMLSIFSAFLINQSNEIIIKSIIAIIISTSILVIAALICVVKNLDKKIEKYFELVKDKAYDYRLDEEWLLMENRKKYDCIDGWYLEDIDKIRKWSEKKDVSFVFYKEHDDEENYLYNEISIHMCKDGKVIDEIKLDSYELSTENINILFSVPGSMNFTFLDKLFWSSKSSLNKYLEFSKRR